MQIQRRNGALPRDCYDAYKSVDAPKIKTCSYCKKQYKRYSGEIEYTDNVDNKTLYYCTYNCRSKARKNRH